jgi:hypothetical protein
MDVAPVVGTAAVAVVAVERDTVDHSGEAERKVFRSVRTIAFRMVNQFRWLQSWVLHATDPDSGMEVPARRSDDRLGTMDLRSTQLAVDTIENPVTWSMLGGLL